jgi:hypothetical protein
MIAATPSVPPFHLPLPVPLLPPSAAFVEPLSHVVFAIRNIYAVFSTHVCEVPDLAAVVVDQKFNWEPVCV